jgi:NADP-dependent 3-hydroxy acid dehydrogenase YdfG
VNALPKVAIVTGAGSGIGRAVTLGLLANGFAVVAAGRRAEPLAGTLEQSPEGRERGLAVPTDVTDGLSNTLEVHVLKLRGKLETRGRSRLITLCA